MRVAGFTFLSIAASTAATSAAHPHSTAATSAANPHSTRIGPYNNGGLQDVDCAIRALALNYSIVATPWADPTAVFDALRLDADCGAARPAASPRAASLRPVAAPDASTFYVSPAGSDAAAGTQGAPFASLPRALAATRAAAPPATIVLRGGTYFLAAPLELGAADSVLTLQAYPGEAPVISGGAPLAGLRWAPAPPRPSPAPPAPISGPFTGSIIDLANKGCVDAPGATNPGVCAPLGKLASAAACAAACVGSSSCTGYTWHDPSCGEWATWCYARLDGQHALDGAAHHFSGWKAGPPPAAPNVWTAVVPPGVAPFDQLFFRGRRLTRARWPNANPEYEQSPVGFAGGAKWSPPAPFPPASETHVDGVRPYAQDFPNFQWGVGGSVANFTTGSFWGTAHPPAGAHFEVPSGIALPTGVPLGSPSNWTRVRGAIVHGFQGGYWGDWHFNVSRVDPGGVLAFDAGGWQEARGGGGNAFYVENVPELLDVAGEWYLNEDSRELSIAFNGTAADGNETLVAAQLHELVRVTGSAAAPVRGVSILGLTFAHTLTDYLLPWTVPSGGDWSFHDGGMVRLAGTVGATIQGCTFAAPGGNGVMISGFNRAAALRENEFALTGSNAIVSAGLGGGLLNASAPDFPEGTLVEANVGREIGVYVKQVGFFYAGVSANFTLRRNVVFNAARAAVNINDDFAGGHLLEKNLLFNTVRETHDHGAVNSWARQPYKWSGERVDPLPIVITRNFIINNCQLGAPPANNPARAPR